MKDFYKKPLFWIILSVVIIIIYLNRDKIFGAKKYCCGGMVNAVNQGKIIGRGKIQRMKELGIVENKTTSACMDWINCSPENGVGECHTAYAECLSSINKA